MKCSRLPVKVVVGISVISNAVVGIRRIAEGAGGSESEEFLKLDLYPRVFANEYLYSFPKMNSNI